MTDKKQRVVTCSQDVRGGGRPNHMEVEELTQELYLHPGVGHRLVRHRANVINSITLKLTLNFTTLTDTAPKYI